MKKRSVKNVKLMLGFTLVELLVVISIIAVLLAILMPSLSKAKESARSTVCKSHIKQIMLAAALWSQDHDGYVVAGMWDVPAKDPGDGTVGDEAKNAIARGASLEPYTASRDMVKGGLYSCPTAISKFGDKFFYSIPEVSSAISGRGPGFKAVTSYGINSFAVMYSYSDYLGSQGVIGTGNGGYYDDWGPNNTYMLEHGKSMVAQIQQPSSKVYFSDFSYIIIYDWMYDPIHTCYWKQSGRGDGAYVFTNNGLADIPAGKPVVQSRWHGTVSKKTGYGYANMGWFDGSVSREPKGFDNPNYTSSGGGFGGSTKIYAWQQYFYIRH